MAAAAASTPTETRCAWPVRCANSRAAARAEAAIAAAPNSPRRGGVGNTGSLPRSVTACPAGPGSARYRPDGREHVAEDGAGAHPKTLVSSTRWSWLGIGSHSSASILPNVSVYSIRLEKAPDGMCGVLSSPVQLS